MTFKIYSFSLLILFIFSCQKEVKKEKPIFDFIKTFAGDIDNKYPLHLKLTSESGQISGTYFYDKVGDDIQVNGSITNDSIIILNEYDQKGNQTGLWTGKYINENKIEGTWSKPNGDGKKEFQLLVTSDNYESSKKSISDNKYAAYSGTYNSPFNEGEISFGYLKIVYIGNQQIEFDITTGHRNGCTGKFNGVAKIKADGSAKYSDSTCKSLIFDFKNNEVNVKENSCDHHGMNCYFRGVYKK